ncbi:MULTISPECIES: peptidoglycan editing factor PgeF [Virgibacillus]|uniref:Purine nucleoside phosphorylase n=1 Tax=Virgibacillus dokdonensis TaxID=302167 RepID=A0A2K9J698_9BACI|nr:MULTISPECIES: peptidoglycan editing factor PgeF [Virgibacillus]AUJ26763.1 Laccase domain protein [Virgibacillus dokdonensis]NWO12789.1 peptidoglycan editing factor PgeF [Virgibacillus sp.]
MSDVFHSLQTTYLHIEKWQRLNERIVAGFTTKKDGVSDGSYTSLNVGFHVDDLSKNVLLNRERIARNVRFPLENWVCGQQVHQTNIHFVRPSDKGKGAQNYHSAIKGVDGLITNHSNIMLSAFFADCVPLYFYDPVTSFIGIAHAGWKGTVHQMAKHMVEKLQRYGVERENLLVTVGPCISKMCYEVDAHVVNQIPTIFKANVVDTKAENRYLLDLKQLNVDILLQSGVLRNNIDVTNYCTYRDETLFFSHRRDHGETGRMLGFIGFLP